MHYYAVKAQYFYPHPLVQAKSLCHLCQYGLSPKPVQANSSCQVFQWWASKITTSWNGLQLIRRPFGLAVVNQYCQTSKLVNGWYFRQCFCIYSTVPTAIQYMSTPWSPTFTNAACKFCTKLKLESYCMLYDNREMALTKKMLLQTSWKQLI